MVERKSKEKKEKAYFQKIKLMRNVSNAQFLFQ